MGGDFAPDVTLSGAIYALQFLNQDEELVLFGEEKIILDRLNKEGINSTPLKIVHCPEVIGMGENPAKAYKLKPGSSIVTGFNYLKSNQIDAFTSAGNSGAMMVGATQSVKQIQGVIRPAIASAWPKLTGGWTVLLDVGINPDCRPDILYQYAIIGKIFAQTIYKINNPRIGLLNLGSEEGKGNLLTKSTYEAMKDSSDFNFIGNVEGNELCEDNADVIVCDGFVGNVMLKQAESFYTIVKSRNLVDEFIERFNFENYGGTPILGINSNVVIGHGISNVKAITNMILQTREVIKAKLSDKIKEAFN